MSSLILLVIYFSMHATTEARDLLHHHQISSMDDLSAERQGREDIHSDQIRHGASTDQKKQSSSSHETHAIDASDEGSEGMVLSQVQSSNYGISGSWHVDDHPGFHLDYLPPRLPPPSHN
ncbi:hypothetical protein Sjap_004308 [Stephania japonica]|uniref:Uncharacterized protein n=1 Tax=Stephania japonica TaxID=461633 RepID=A0AAP0K4A0_9MAGN